MSDNKRFFSYIKARIINQKLQLLLSCVFAVLMFMQHSLFIGDNTSNFDGLSTLVFVLSCAGLFIMSYICGINSFNYLHDKNMTDMVISLPINRKPRFWGDFIAGLTVVLGPYTLSALASLPLLIFYHSTNPNSSIPDYWLSHSQHFPIFQIMVAGFLILLFMYSMTVFAVSLCGRIFEAISVPIIFGILIPATTLLFVLITYGNTYGVHNDLEQFMLPLYATSPFMFAYWSMSAIYSYFIPSMVLNEILLAMLVTALFIAGAFFLNITRKAEDTGKPFPVKVFFHIYISLIGFCVTAVFMYFITMRISESPFSYYNSGITIGLLVILMILITFFVYFLFDVINNKGFKKPLLVLGRWVVTTGASAAVCLGLFSTGGFGAVNYIPPVNRIESVSINMWNFERFNEPYFYDHARGTWKITFEEEENIELVREFHRRALTLRGNVIFSGADTNSAPPMSHQSISYTMNSGRRVERGYFVTDEVFEPIIQLILSDEYKEYKLSCVAGLLNSKGSYIEIYIGSSQAGHGRIFTVSDDKNLFEEFLEAYRKDLYAETVEQMFSQNNCEYMIMASDSTNFDGFRIVSRHENYFYVKPHFTNLLEFIENLDFDQDLEVAEIYW
jgi:hypothetical protein